jgi:hypothetical protein
MSKEFETNTGTLMEHVSHRTQLIIESFNMKTTKIESLF